jgi:hypothetical protein
MTLAKLKEKLKYGCMSKLMTSTDLRQSQREAQTRLHAKTNELGKAQAVSKRISNTLACRSRYVCSDLRFAQAFSKRISNTVACKNKYACSDLRFA